MIGVQLRSIASKATWKTSVSHAMSGSRLPALSMAVRTFADVDIEVEHGRGEWKTYGDLENYKPGKHQIQTFNKISPIGLARFPEEHYDVFTGDQVAPAGHAILLRSHKLQLEEVAHTVRAIAR